MTKRVFFDTHVHSCFSYGDGVSSPRDLARQAKKLGYPALALTDHASIEGWYQFYKACKNEGIGIPKGKQKFIFSKFFRAKNAVEKMGTGTGLGLYITNEMVKLNDGEIWFVSNLNEVTVFHVKLKAYKNGKS